MNLYWVITENHDEDWFVKAHDSDGLKDFYEKTERYNKGMAVAKPVMEILGHTVEDVGWPSTTLFNHAGQHS